MWGTKKKKKGEQAERIKSYSVIDPKSTLLLRTSLWKN